MKRAVILLLLAACASRNLKPAPQNPSPMVENTRAHERVQQRAIAGKQFHITDVFEKPVDVDITPACSSSPPCDLVVHFLGASWLPMQAAEDTGRPIVMAVVNLGAGGSKFAAPFAADKTLFTRLRERIASQSPALRATYLSGFSAGYGSIREIITQQPDTIDGILLIDGMHTGYVPDKKVVAEGGKLDESKLTAFVRYAQRAANGEKHFVMTHSEIFPGTFASTTETSDYLLTQLGIARTPVVKWGPHGMQQLSEARRGNFVVMGFAGNSGPDHIDQLHGIGTFLPLLWGRICCSLLFPHGVERSLSGVEKTANSRCDPSPSTMKSNGRSGHRRRSRYILRAHAASLSARGRPPGRTTRPAASVQRE